MPPVVCKKPKPTARQERDIGVRDVLRKWDSVKDQIGETSSGYQKVIALPSLEYARDVEIRNETVRRTDPLVEMGFPHQVAAVLTPIPEASKRIS